MRKAINIWFLCVMLTIFCAVNLSAETVNSEKNTTAIVYFSQTGNTRTACETVAKKISADVFELQVAKPPAAKGQLPEIAPAALDMAPYSFVVVASPVWAANLVPAVRAFLKNNSLGGKKAIVLTTTNAAMPEQFQVKHKKLVMDSGGDVIGYYQLVMMEQKDDKPVPRPAVEIQKDTRAIAAEILKVVSQ